MKKSDIWGNCLNCCLLWFQRWRWYEQSPLSVVEVQNGLIKYHLCSEIEVIASNAWCLSSACTSRSASNHNMEIGHSVRPSRLGPHPLSWSWMAGRRRWCNVVSNHTSTWCVSCTRHHSATDQVWMFHQSSMFHWDVWLCCSSNVMLDVLLLQCWVRLL